MPDTQSSFGLRDVRLARDGAYGFLKVDPMPDAAAIAEFYEKKYFSVMADTGRAPDIVKLMRDDERARAERDWLGATVYRDIADAFRRHAPGLSTLDAGCGSGDLVEFLAREGFRAAGFDPSPEAVRHGRARGLDIRQAGVESFAQVRAGETAHLDAISLLGVLECLPDAAAALTELRRNLRPNGVLYLRVGNQFNLLQLAARDALKLDSWWITVPDHLNYFDRQSLLKLLDGVGFDVIDTWSDFPMEMFLLMGENYRADPAVGSACHARRVAFEMALPKEQRRALYRGFAAQGIGRCIHVVARKRG